MALTFPLIILLSLFSFGKFIHAEEPYKEACLACHTNSKPLVNAVELEKSVHKGFQCTDCHQDASLKTSRRISKIPHELPGKVNCSMCHGNIAEEHSSGVHRAGKEILSGNPCTNCHGTHGIFPKTDKKSPVNRANIPLTCKKCHLGVFNNFIKSAHGKLWESGDARGPICITCHKAHKIENVFSQKFRVGLPQECATCHEDKAPTYEDTFHGQATSIGYLVTAKCSDCHTAHLNLPQNDPDSTVNSQNLMTTCGKCHPDANKNFVQYDPHPDPHNREKSPLIYYVFKFMVLLLAFVFSFFGLHTFLWLQRSVVAMLRGEVKKTWKEDKYIVRFDRRQRLTHIFIVISFLGLAATGIPLKYHYTDWAKVISTLLGGVEVARYFHRLFAVITGGYVVFHLYYFAQRFILKGRFRDVSVDNSIIPQTRDLFDLYQNLRWFFYLGERPRIGRWSYWEKFDYFAIFWGIPVIGLSGLVLWFPEFFTRLFPGIVINLAMIIHGEEALLAIGFIFTFHFFHNHLRPENFPLDTTIFTGRLPLERFIDERPEEYEKLKKEGKLEEMTVGPPSEASLKFARIFGFSALTLGMILVIFIFIAFFS